MTTKSKLTSAVYDKIANMLEYMPEEFGTLRESHAGEDPNRFVLIFQDNPENWSIRWAIGKALASFKFIKLACRAGSWGPIDTSLGYSIPDREVQEELVLYFLRKLMIDGIEYAHILRGEEHENGIIKLCGVDDEKLYNEALTLFSDQGLFVPHQIKRAKVITQNILTKMSDLGLAYGALAVGGDLPDLVSEELEMKGISFAIIMPKMSYPSDKESYKKLLFDKGEDMLSYAELLSISSDKLPPPPRGQFPDKKMEEKKEQYRKYLLELVRSERLLPKIKSIIPSTKCAKITETLNSSSYGPKAKAVIVKGEIFGFTKQLQKDKISILGLLGVVAAITGSLFSLTIAFEWYRMTNVGLFALAALNSLVHRRFLSCVSWTVYILGFVVGFYFYGRWGILVGILIAAVFAFIIFAIGEVKRQQKIAIFQQLHSIIVGEQK